MDTRLGNPLHLLPPTGYSRMIAAWLEEDCPAFDIGGFVVGDKPAEASLWGKGQGILAGVPFFDEVFRQLDCQVQWHISEGTVIEPVVLCATVRGPVRKLLLGERVALNILARCSGIATRTNKISLAMPNPMLSRPILAGTRKTTPGFRLCEKYAMAVGGADTHRHTLSHMTMLKDNHIAARGGSVGAAIAAARSAGSFATKIEVEVSNLDDAITAVDEGADIVMLDNFAPGKELAAAVEQVRAHIKSLRGTERARDVLIEISGGVDEANIAGYCVPGVDIISTSAIHQGVKHLDFSLKIVSE